MKIYSDTLTTRDLYDALPERVDIAVIGVIARPRKRANGWVISLTGTSPYRSQVSERGHQAATWDEHGLWMAELYRRDPEAVIGHYKTIEQFTDDTRNMRDFYRDNPYYKPTDRQVQTHQAPWLTPNGSLLRVA